MISRVSFSIFVAFILLPAIISSPRHFNLDGKSNPAFGTEAEIQAPDGNPRSEGLTNNQNGETANRKSQNGALEGVSSQETASLPGETNKSSTANPKTECSGCYCKRPVHKDCVSVCCNTTSTTEEIPLLDASSVQNSINDSITDRKDSTESSSESQPVKFSESENPLPSKPSTFDSDISSETSPVSNSAIDWISTWTVIFVFVISLTLIISAFRYAKQWRRDKLRENYLIDGLYSEARPLCLNDMLEN